MGSFHAEVDLAVDFVRRVFAFLEVVRRRVVVVRFFFAAMEAGGPA